MKKYKIRKLTPRECGRLMGVEDKDIDTMLTCGLSDNALYKMYGNSIVVNCMVHMFDNLFLNRPVKPKDSSLW
jgi:DNA (cytosine-5)-methyltransferase 1